ncbi:MAG: hypothetical protein QOH90_542, partial [Actinomycetota bacterium]|nr:hypothetical protein [Actinomycetota bacterium]
MKKFVSVACLALVLCLQATPALAKSFSLPQASIDVQVDQHGGIHVTERLTYEFDGDFSGGYREIPLRSGESIDDVSVTEGGTQYQPGASAELGSFGSPGTFGTTRIAGPAFRIVWHYSASSERRTFTVRYTIHGLTVAHDDVADVNLQVWGDEWKTDLDRLDAKMQLPGAAPEEVRVWGHSRAFGGTDLDPEGTGATLFSTDVPAQTFVEMRVVFPTRLLTDTRDARVVPGQGLPDIIAEETAFAVGTERELSRERWLRRNAGWLIALGLLLAFVPAAAMAAYIWVRHGKEYEVGEKPNHVFEPPGGDPPATIVALLEPGYTRVTGNAFTATLFDLIRKGYIDSIPTTTHKKTWAGLREEDVSDLAVKETDKDQAGLEPFEQIVLKTITHATKGKDRLMLTELKDELESEPTYYSGRYTAFKEAVGAAVRLKSWWEPGAGGITAAICVLLWVLTGISFFIAVSNASEPGASFFVPVLAGSLAGIFFTNALIMTAFAFYRRGWERRSHEGAEAAAKWEGFRRFLTDFAGMKEAVPGSIEVWEQYLCYGIAFGVAERVLAAAQLHAPPELGTESNLYFVTPHGPLGYGGSAFLFHDISSTVASVAP